MLKKLLLSIIILFFSNLIFINNINAQGLKNGFDSGPLEKITAESNINKNTTLDGMIAKIIQLFLSFLGVIFLVLTIYGGYLWMTARGNESQVETAKKIITSSVIGLIIIIGAYVITTFVLNNLIKDYIK